jgi:hypothetical protein
MRMEVKSWQLQSLTQQGVANAGLRSGQPRRLLAVLGAMSAAMVNLDAKERLLQIRLLRLRRDLSAPHPSPRIYHIDPDPFTLK